MSMFCTDDKVLICAYQPVLVVGCRLQWVVHEVGADVWDSSATVSWHPTGRTSCMQCPQTSAFQTQSIKKNNFTYMTKHNTHVHTHTHTHTHTHCYCYCWYNQHYTTVSILYGQSWYGQYQFPFFICKIVLEDNNYILKSDASMNIAKHIM